MPRTPSTPTRGRGPYATQACNVCRLRKTKCSGEKPVCQSCVNTGQDCTWGPDNPKRVNNTQMLRKRIKDLESYICVLEAALAQCCAEQGDSAGNKPSYLEHRPEMPVSSDEADDPESSTDSDVDRETEKLRALKLEDSDLQLYGPTSIFQYAPKSPERVSRFPEIVENTSLRYVLLVNDADRIHYNPDFDWCRHLPPEVPLDRQEHDKILDLLFKFFTCWCLRIVPDLFLRDMCRALSLPRSQTAPKTTHYSPMLHNALVALATAFSDDPRIRDIKSRKYYATAARNYIDIECQSPNISAVHALSILGSFHSSQGEQTLGYMYFGMSGRISQALGLSIDASPWVKANLISENDMLDRNWAHWTTFSLDVCWSLYVGREACVSSPSDNQKIPVPFVDTDFDQIPWHYPPSGIPPQPNYLSRTFAETCELLRIARRILDVVSVLNSPGTRRNVNHDLISQIDDQLNDWKASLPPEVDITMDTRPTATPHRLMMHLSYWQLFILLHRPFYRRTRLSTGSEREVDHVTYCNTSAQNIMELVATWKDLYTLRYVPITFIQVVFSAGTIFLLSAVQATSRSRPVGVSISDLLSQAELCSRYLHESGRSWPCANHVANILGNLLREQLKPRLRSTKRRSQSTTSNVRRASDPAASIVLHDPYERGTSLSPRSDRSHSGRFLTGGDPFVGGSNQTGDHFVPPWVPSNPHVVDTTNMTDTFGEYVHMDLGSPMGLAMRSGETLRPFISMIPLELEPGSSQSWNFSDEELQQLLQQLDQQEHQFMVN